MEKIAKIVGLTLMGLLSVVTFLLCIGIGLNNKVMMITCSATAVFLILLTIVGSIYYANKE